EQDLEDRRAEHDPLRPGIAEELAHLLLHQRADPQQLLPPDLPAHVAVRPGSVPAAAVRPRSVAPAAVRPRPIPPAALRPSPVPAATVHQSPFPHAAARRRLTLPAGV